MVFLSLILSRIKVPNIKINPTINTLAQTIWDHNLTFLQMNDHIQYEWIINNFLSNFKVRITTQEFQTQIKSNQIVEY